MDDVMSVLLNQPSYRRGQVTPDEDTRKRFKEHYKRKLLEYGYEERVPRNTDILARYMASYYLDAVPKGLCLIGDTGTGKTHAMEMLSKLFGKVPIIRARDSVEWYQTCGPKRRTVFWEDYDRLPHKCYYNEPGKPNKEPYNIIGMDLILDDIGTEVSLNEFGTKVEVMDSVVDRRYEAWRNKQAMTHITCNLAIAKAYCVKCRSASIGAKKCNDCGSTDICRSTGDDDLLTRYGKRFYSRLHEMCYVFIFGGPDQRLKESN